MEKLEMEKLLKRCLANTFVFYFKAHSYHWNVEGIHFSQYHSFFGELYQELYSAIDPMAEEIRALDAYAPISLTSLYDQKSIMEDEQLVIDIGVMLNNLYNANQLTVACLKESFDYANANNMDGLADFLAGRLDVHAKHGWMLKSSMKGN